MKFGIFFKKISINIEMKHLTLMQVHDRNLSHLCLRFPAVAVMRLKVFPLICLKVACG